MFANSTTTLRISAVPSMSLAGFTVRVVTTEPLALRRCIWCTAPASGLVGTLVSLDSLSMEAKNYASLVRKYASSQNTCGNH